MAPKSKSGALVCALDRWMMKDKTLRGLKEFPKSIQRQIGRHVRT